MVLELIDCLCKCLSHIWISVLAAVGIKSTADTVSSSAYYDCNYSMGANKRAFSQPMYQHDFSRSVTNRTAANRLSSDADRFTNQSSVSSSVVTLPRPFHAAVRQAALSSGTSLSNSSNTLVHRNTSQSSATYAQSGTQRSGGSSSAPSSSPWVEVPISDGKTNDQKVAFSMNALEEVTYTTIQQLDSERSDAQPFHAAVGNLVGGSKPGLRGSRPLVKLDRLTMLARGTAPDSSAVYSSAPSSFVEARHPRSQSTDAPPVINRIKNLSGKICS